MEKGSLVRLTIEDMSADGQGIGKADGFAVFVRGALPGDVVMAELTKVKKSYGLARVRELLEPSSARREAFCPYFRQCGGCAYQELAYESQLELKRKQVSDKLRRLGGLADPRVQKTIGMDAGPDAGMKTGLNERGQEKAAGPVQYRNKAVMAVSTGGLVTKKGGIVVPVYEPRVGFFQAKSHEVVDCSSCALQAPPAMAAADALRRFMREDNITSYDERWDKGLMKHMIVRTAFGTGQVMVILVINGRGIPNLEKLVRLLDEAIYALPPETDGPLAGVEFSLESVVINVNKGKTSAVLGEECITVAGAPVITESLGGLSFEISPLSFYQVNPRQMLKLYDKVLEYASLRGEETVLDLYCGVGSIGLFCADQMRRQGGSGRVVGIESVRQAVLDANRNAVINGIVNATYVCGRAEEELPKLADLKAEVAILDPPRAGCRTELLKAVAQAAVPRLIYVSCDAATMARDIRELCALGYIFEEATPVDMFPWTGGIEVVAKLSYEMKGDEHHAEG